MHRTTRRFWQSFEALPGSVQRIARRNFELLKANPSYPSLRFKRIGKLWSVAVGMNHRALAVEDGDDFIWVWIGAHDEYERIIKEMA